MMTQLNVSLGQRVKPTRDASIYNLHPLLLVLVEQHENYYFK